MRTKRALGALGAMGLLSTLCVGCAGGELTNAVTMFEPALSGEWAVTAAAPAGAVLGGRLILAADRSWRFRYDYRAEDTGQVWSSGLSGRWTFQPGEPAAVRFEVLDDHSTVVGLLRGGDTLEVALRGLSLRLVRAPE